MLGHTDPERAAARRAKRDKQTDRYIELMADQAQREAQRTAALARPIHYLARIVLAAAAACAAVRLGAFYLAGFNITLTHPSQGGDPLAVNTLITAPHIAGYSLVAIIATFIAAMAGAAMAWKLYTATVGDRVLAARANRPGASATAGTGTAGSAGSAAAGAAGGVASGGAVSGSGGGQR